MYHSANQKERITSGIPELDRALGGLFIGDNVVWHDDAGSLAAIFCLNFIRAGREHNKHIIYVSFDRSPRNLLEKLGPLAEYPYLTILDCFTWGKGAGSDVFLRFYYDAREWPCRIIRVDDPKNVDQVMDALYGVHAGMTDDVRFVFESITGMQELWGGEDDILKFYAHSCPRLYELNTIAYWVLEKNAHSHRLRAQINQIAQVAIDLSVKRGTTSLTILKAEQRQMATLHKAVTYWTNDLGVSFQDDRRASGPLELGLRIKEARTKRGLSQTELAKLIGVTPSTISQIESNSIYPSLPALFKMAEVLSCEVGYFFHGRGGKTNHVFPSSKAIEVKIGNIPDGLLSARMLVPMDFDHKSEPYLIEVAPESIINSHFFLHKGEEMGYLLSGKLHMTVGDVVQKLRPGDLVYITTDIPTRWFNPGPNSAKLLWMKMK